MAPDVFPDEDGAGSSPQQDPLAKNNSCLANLKSAKANCRQYAVGCHYSGRLPDTCLVIDLRVTPYVDLLINVATATGFCTDRKISVMDGKTVVPYKTNTSVPMKVLQSVVLSMCRIATYFFPEVLSVIRDTKGDTGLPPVSPMDGAPPSKVVPPSPLALVALPLRVTHQGR